MKLKYLTLIIASLLSMAFIQSDLETKKILDNQLTMLIPSDFTHISKDEYVPDYQGAPAPDDYFGSSDKSFEVTIMKMPERTENLDWCKAFSQSAFLARASATHFNDAVTVNQIQIHLTEFESVFNGKATYSKMFFLNLDSSTVIGNISFDLEQKEQLLPQANEMFNSIKKN